LSIKWSKVYKGKSNHFSP